MGILIFEMMTGIPPFTNENQSKFTTMILTFAERINEVTHR
jgi:hypothetical protein